MTQLCDTENRPREVFSNEENLDVTIRQKSTPTSVEGSELLNALPQNESELISPHLDQIRILQGQVLYEPGQKVEQIYFIECGFASTLVDKASKADGVEVGLIGHDSLVGLEFILSDDARSFGSVVMRAPGSALAMSASTLRGLLPRLPTLKQALMLELALRLVRLEQSAVCNVRHGVRERLARWLLTAQGRSSTKSLPVTQDALSSILAVGRSSVNLALKELFDAGVVRGWRGHLTVCDRPGLEALACDCYRQTEAFAAMLAKR